jgi:hypothetical protein
VKLVDFMQAVENDSSAYADMQALYDKMIGLYGSDLTAEQQDVIRSGDAFRVSAMIEKERHMLARTGNAMNQQMDAHTVTWVIAMAEVKPEEDVASHAVTSQPVSDAGTASPQDPAPAQP